MRYKYLYHSEIHYIEESDKDKCSYMFSIDNDIKKENDFLLKYAIYNERKLSYSRCKDWLKQNHPELLL